MSLRSGKKNKIQLAVETPFDKTTTVGQIIDADDVQAAIENSYTKAKADTKHNDLTDRDTAGNHAKIIPVADTTTAIQITKADGVTPVLTIDTLNQKTVHKAKSGTVVGSELIQDVQDRDFSGDTGNWSGTGWTVGSGVLTHVAGANTVTLLNTTIPQSKTYQVVFTVTTTTAGTLTPQIGGVDGPACGQITGTLTDYTVLIYANISQELKLVPNATWAGTIDNVSIKEITAQSSVIDFYNSLNVLGSEFRTSNNTSLGIGLNSLEFNVTGVNNTALGYNTLCNNTTGYNNTAIGSNVLCRNTTGYNNVSIGLNTLTTNTVGFDNTALGLNVLVNNISGYNNLGIGKEALKDNTVGYNNVAIGTYSMSKNTTGNSNLSLGTNSLYTNTTGHNNVALGNSSLLRNTSGDSNVSIGSSSMYSNTTGHSNVSVGINSLFSNTGGASNTSVGRDALLRSTTGHSLTAIGKDSLFYNTTGVSSTAIGINSLYNVKTGSSNIGIGRDSGRYFDTGTSALLAPSESIFIGELTRASADGNTREIVIGHNIVGNGSNTTTIDNIYDATTAVAANVTISTTGQLMRSTSSRRLKTDIEPIGDTYSEKIYDLQPVYYRSICDADNQDHTHWGLIAEDVDLIDPRLVDYGYWPEDYEEFSFEIPIETTNSEGEIVMSTEVVVDKRLKADAVKTPIGVQYTKLIPLLLQEIQKLNERIKVLEGVTPAA